MKSESDLKKLNQWFFFIIIIQLIVLFLSIIIPLILINSNQAGSCLHHFEENNGIFWIIGRSMGFTAFTWFIISNLYGINTKRLARRLKSYQKARDLHCLNAIITIIVFLVHVGALLNSDPWGGLIFEGEYNHIPFPFFIIKLWTGILFGVIMISVATSAFYFRDMTRMKRFGFNNFIKIHYIMLSLSFILAIHIFLINTEILVIFWG